MKADPRILTIDIGTTSVKVVLFDASFRARHAAVREYALETGPGGRVEIDPETWLDAVRGGIAEVLSREGSTAGVAAVSVTTQGETVVPVDAEGRPLAKAVVWLDARAVEEAEFLSTRIDADRFYRTTGLPGISPSLPLAKLLWFRRRRPELYGRTHRFLLAEDFVLHWLTGRFATEKSLATSTGWFDLHADAYWTEALHVAGVDAGRLPEALRCGEPVGTLRAERAEELGLPHDAVVAAGAMDQAAAALGAGCVRPGVVTETTGTALVLAAFTRTPSFAHPSRVTVYRHALDGAFLYLPIGITAGMALKWFKDNFCVDLAQAGGDAYAALDALAASVPAGSGGLVVLPHLAGTLDPDDDPDAKAVFFGATLDTKRAHFARGILESVAYLLRDLVGILREAGVEPKEIRSMGGGARSRLWLRIKADVLGLPVARMACTESASLGAAVLAAWGAGMLDRGTFPPVDEADERFEPSPADAPAYARGYRMYRALSAAVKPLFRGVPEEKEGSVDG